MKKKQIPVGTSTEQEIVKKEKRPQTAILRANFHSIIDQIANGSPLKHCLQTLHLNQATFFRYIDKRPELRDIYSRAQRAMVHGFVAEIVPMSDAVIGQEMSVVTATRNACDQRKWVASKLMPREYGDAPSAISIHNNTNVLVMSEEKLAALQAARKRNLLANPDSQSPA